MKIEIDANDEWPWVLIGGLMGFAIGMIIVLIINSQAISEYNYRQYKTEHPSSTITYEDYKRLKG